MAAAAIGLFLVGYYWGNQYRHGDSTPPIIEGVRLRPPLPLPDFALRDTAGQTFTAEHLAGHWTLLSFGNPDQAPSRSAVVRMIEVHNRLAGDPDLRERLLLALVTRREGPTLAVDSGHSLPVLRFLSGPADELQRLQAALGTPEQAATMTAAQPIPCYLIGPAGRLSALFPGIQMPASIASDLAAIATHAVSSDPADD